MSTRLRIVLPSLMGILSLPLVLWDIHNERVIESIGMGWDTGAPIWPYQASDILLRLLNGPAYSVAMPIANLLRLAAPTHYLLVVPAILIWWWFLGSILERRLARWPVFGMFVVLVALLLWAATSTPSVFRLRIDYRASHLSTTLLILRFLTPAAWFTLLTSLLLVKARRVVSCKLA
jgi:hypothetical protein